MSGVKFLNPKIYRSVGFPLKGNEKCQRGIVGRLARHKPEAGDLVFPLDVIVLFCAPAPPQLPQHTQMRQLLLAEQNVEMNAVSDLLQIDTFA
ncbi:MAG: hypothetical protein KF886_04670 [Candidatus Hydrogenedentes bacterium]|nr:hypothetical protein [Candidatus Hydrogenedentota bacterium]